MSIYVAIFSDQLGVNIPRDVVKYTTRAGLPEESIPALFNATTVGTPEALNSVPGINGEIIEALNLGTMAAYKSSFRVVYLASLAFGIMSIISALFVQDVSEFLTGFVNKTIHAPQMGKRQDEVTEKDVKGVTTEDV